MNKLNIYMVRMSTWCEVWFLSFELKNNIKRKKLEINNNSNFKKNI